MTAPFFLEQSAALIGGHLDYEHRLFVSFGKASTTNAPDAIVVALARYSLLHGQRASELEARLPLAAAFDRASFIAPYDHSVVAVFSALDDVVASAHDGAGALVAAVAASTLLPSLAATYVSHLERCTPWTDGPISRFLRAAVIDLADEISHLNACTAMSPGDTPPAELARAIEAFSRRETSFDPSEHRGS